jgi:hypothetical protein
MNFLNPSWASCSSLTRELCVFRLVTEKINEKSDDVDFFSQCPSVWYNEIDENKNNVKVILDPYRP